MECHRQAAAAEHSSRAAFTRENCLLLGTSARLVPFAATALLPPSFRCALPSRPFCYPADIVHTLPAYPLPHVDITFELSAAL